MFGQKIIYNFVKSNINILGKAANWIAKKSCGIAAGFAAGNIGQALLGAAWSFTSLGGIFAFGLDLIDGVYDGAIRW